MCLDLILNGPINVINLLVNYWNFSFGIINLRIIIYLLVRG